MKHSKTPRLLFTPQERRRAAKCRLSAEQQRHFEDVAAHRIGLSEIFAAVRSLAYVSIGLAEEPGFVSATCRAGVRNAFRDTVAAMAAESAQSQEDIERKASIINLLTGEEYKTLYGILVASITADLQAEFPEMETDDIVNWLRPFTRIRDVN